MKIHIIINTVGTTPIAPSPEKLTHTMKKSLFMIVAALAAMATVSCNNAENNAEGADSTATEATVDTNKFPWVFPQNVKLNAEPGQLVLAPYTFYPSKVEEGKELDNTSMILYYTTMTEVGETTSKLNDGKVEIPNALIIPLDKNGTAKKGDILLTWWQQGSGLKRAIVVDDSNPAEPLVDYLDLDYGTDEKPGLGQKDANKPLKPSSFNVIADGQWQPGAQIAYFNGKEWEAGTLIHEQDGKVIAQMFAAIIKAYPKDKCKLIPFKEDIKEGDKVFATFTSSYRDGYTVLKVDNAIGRVWVKDQHGSESVKSIAEVTKSL